MLHTTKHFLEVRDDDTYAVDIDKEVRDATDRDNVRTTIPIGSVGLRLLSQYYPLVQSPSDLDALAERLSSTYREVEHGCSPIFSPSLIEASCQRGIFPMSIKISGLYYTYAPKLHKQRNLTQLQPPVKGFPMSSDENEGVFLLSRLHVSKKFLRDRNETTRAMSFDIFINRKEDLAPVLSLIQKQHGENWMCHALRLCFAHMFLNAGDYSTKIVVIAVRRHIYTADAEERDKEKCACMPSAIDNGTVKEGDLVAAEMGFLVGDIYSSLSGAYSVGGAGTLQLAATGVALQSVGCKVWDLGMYLKYKEDMLGSVSIPRGSWSQLVREHTSNGAITENIYGLLCKDYRGGVPVRKLLLTRRNAEQQRIGE